MHVDQSVFMNGLVHLSHHKFILVSEVAFWLSLYLMIYSIHQLLHMQALKLLKICLVHTVNGWLLVPFCH